MLGKAETPLMVGTRQSGEESVMLRSSTSAAGGTPKALNPKLQKPKGPKTEQTDCRAEKESLLKESVSPGTTDRRGYANP